MPLCGTLNWSWRDLRLRVSTFARKSLTKARVFCVNQTAKSLLNNRFDITSISQLLVIFGNFNFFSGEIINLLNVLLTIFWWIFSNYSSLKCKGLSLVYELTLTNWIINVLTTL